MNNNYFRRRKKTGPPVETGRPLRLLDMRIFNDLCCADTTACNGKMRGDYVTEHLPFPIILLNNKLTVRRQFKRINLLPEILSLN